ncbi:MAG: methyltransferase domain-containing protein [Pseudomonadota bacterium]
MTKPATFLDSVYDLDGADKTRDLYKAWAATYDDELRANGYASPERVAKAMADCVSDLSEPLLDLGCGTGLSGAAFRDAGFTNVDGTDFSAEMLEVAKAKAIYRAIVDSDPATPIPVGRGDYRHFAAVGVFSPGHAPAELISAVAERMPNGGCFGFTLNDHALEDDRYEKGILALAEAGAIEIAFKDYGAHLPRIDLKSMVYVLKKRAE